MNKLLFSCELCKRELNLKEAIKYVLGEIEKLKATTENKKEKRQRRTEKLNAQLKKIKSWLVSQTGTQIVSIKLSFNQQNE